MFQTIAVVGSGTMGNGIAHLFAQSGYNVHLIDISAAQLEKALLTINKNLDRQIAKGIVTDEQKKSALARISVFQDMEKGAAGAGLVIEAATERIDLKLDLFARLDKCLPGSTRRRRLNASWLPIPLPFPLLKLPPPPPARAR